MLQALCLFVNNLDRDASAKGESGHASYRSIQVAEVFFRPPPRLRGRAGLLL
jgi:hypothetical protein